MLAIREHWAVVDDVVAAAVCDVSLLSQPRLSPSLGTRLEVVAEAFHHTLVLGNVQVGHETTEFL